MPPVRYQNRFNAMPISPFGRLRALISNTNPGLEPIDMSIGEPRHAPPAFVRDILHNHFEDFGKYPPIRGRDELRSSISNWLKKRFGLSTIDSETHILPLCGTREGLFYAAFLSDAVQDASQPAYIMMPNPFYLCYAAASLAAGKTPYYLPAEKNTGYLPNLEGLEATVLDATELYYYCSPSNPQGAVADEAYQKKLLALSRKHNFIILADECYADIYTETPPVSLLTTSEAQYGDLKNILSFHSLSKRSNLAGLRSGFCAGDPLLIAEFERLRNVAGPQMSIPIQIASAKVWEDTNHVDQNRQAYRDKLSLSDELLSSWPGYKRPDAGFFLWLDMAEFGGGEKAAKTLWEKAGLRTIPGGFLAQTEKGQNPGENNIRMALVGDIEQTNEALKRLKDVFGV